MSYCSIIKETFVERIEGGLLFTEKFIYMYWDGSKDTKSPAVGSQS